MQVLIVDDEPYMVDYLRKLVDWEQYGFEWRAIEKVQSSTW